MKLLPMGPLAVLVDDIDDPAGWAAALRGLDLPGVVDVVPAARTVLVVADDRAVIDAVRAAAPHVVPHTVGGVDDAVVIEVRYDGPDLHDVAVSAGCTVDEVIGLHTGATYRVEFCGFAPGFGYLSGLPEPLHLPRRSTPRTRVPAGSVAIAAGYTAVYPTASPGGWHLIGSTGAAMFDADREPPAILTPGATVRFVAQ